MMSSVSVLFVVLLSEVNLEYAGEDFPESYLDSDGDRPTVSDLNLYLDRLTRITSYMKNRANFTDVNQAIAAFLATAMLKRSLQDYRHKLGKQKIYVKNLVKSITDVISHYIYLKRKLGWKSLEYRLSRLMKDDTAIVYSIRKFRRNLLKNWILNYTPSNEFVPFMDQLSLPKEKYVELVETINGKYNITGYDSDTCLSRLVESIEPINEKSLNPCKRDEFCKEKIFVSPSVAYSLSHRLLNSMMYMHARRCYHYSPSIDRSHMDMLCAAMYREAVYIARRGYFYRDIFLEQIGLCGHLGYEEFHRRRWFRKAAGWIDDDGCMQEFTNFEINRTKLVATQATSRQEVKKVWKALNVLLRDECHHHPMAVAMMALASAVRYTAHHMDNSVEATKAFRL